MLNMGPSDGPSFDMIGVLRRRGSLTHEQIPEENVDRAKAMGAQLEGGHLQAKEYLTYQHRILPFQLPELQKNKALLSKHSQTVLFVTAAPSKPMPLLSYGDTSLTGCLAPLKYDSAFHWLCLERWHCGGRLASDLSGSAPVSEGFIAISPAWT